LKRIIISVSNDLVTDQRVAKICGTLKDFGYEILLIGRMNYSTHTLEREYKTKRFRLLFNKGFLFYAEYSFRLFFFLLFSKKDILYANDLDTLLPNYLISKIQRKKIIFDSHELFSEIPELRNRRFIKLFWLRLEKWILPKLKHVITVSRSIKRHYESLYKIKVTVVRNLPVKLKTTSIPFDFMSKEEKIILYQGSTNIGRGLELAIDTMVVLEDYILVIIGSGDIIDMLKKKTSNLGLENKVKFLGKILPEKLKNLTPNAHIGISLEEDLGLNYRYSLPNKIFDYIQAEIPIIVSDLPEMGKIVDNYQVGAILKNRNPESLANLIKGVRENNFQAALVKAKKELVWENEKKKLIDCIVDVENE
tara:strand:- start:26129 stop:27220 length:1092 start_codon:yes stop_codon:yes gene_type:complete